MQFNKKISISLQAILLWLTLFALQIIYFFQFNFAFNEMDVLPYAKAVYDPNYLSNDWYLQLEIAYRYLFSFPLGFLVEKGGFVFALILGRLVSYAFISLALTRLVFSLKQANSSLLFVFATLVFFVFFSTGMGAGEWMIGGLETKVFAYGFVLLSLNAALKNKLTWTIVFAAIALDFHILIGIYHLFSLIPIFYLQRQKTGNLATKIGVNIGLFLLVGSFGLYGILQGILDNSELGNEAWRIYTQIRVPFHTLPSQFPHSFWYSLLGFNLIIGFIYKHTKQENLKLLTSYIFFTSLICVIGLVVFAFSDQGNMRFYFFRFSDALLPLLTLFASSAFILEKQKDFPRLKESYLTLVLGASILLLSIPRLVDFAKEFKTERSSILENSVLDLSLGKWISTHTSKDAIFIIPPEEAFFYVQCNRAQFVSWKHFPQDKKSILEWYRRLKLLNTGKDFTRLEEVSLNYKQLNAAELKQIIQQEEKLNYILMPKTNRLDLPVVKVGKVFVLYSLK